VGEHFGDAEKSFPENENRRTQVVLVTIKRLITQGIEQKHETLSGTHHHQENDNPRDRTDKNTV
jgi:hypothetical protein